MEPVAYWRALRKSWILIVVLMIVGLAVSFGVGKALPDSYKATTSVFVTAAQGSNTTELQQGAIFTQGQVQSYAQLATTPAVLRPVINDLGLKTTTTDLAKKVTSTNPLNTVIVQISVSDSSASQAARIANGISASLRTVVSDIAPSSKGGASAVRVSIVTPAQAPTSPSSPDRHLLDVAGLLIGLVIAVIIALARAASDKRIRSEQDIEALTDAPVIGRVQRPGRRDAIILRDAPTDPSAEDYRRIRATLQFAGLTGAVTSLTVTSPSDHEERAAFAINLALSSAERSQRVLLIDADLRGVGTAAATGVSSTHGLVDVLGGSVSLADAVVQWNGVDVLPTGAVPSNPTVVLGSPSLAGLLAEARDQYDFVIVDTPPLLPYADALAVVRETDGALVLASDMHTTRPELLRTLTSLDGVKATTIGVVLVDSHALVRSARATAPTSSRAAAAPASAAPASASTAGASATSSSSQTATSTDDVEADDRAAAEHARVGASARSPRTTPQTSPRKPSSARGGSRPAED
ncbi:hypothetical protein AX769_19845 [Frondihabitans sp. PAMC 28766]|uniref:polysaccharide biosynthesis tyrosine autokinase n=1 Tax=Frondihabitans sp. PAMC 28766 TaxID=1795630 RepID=UPI00078BFD51|nr:polysaccharide biosynthesis tyrosine autokinase [Frondihabitans sp. PAMC 28766]AMM21987.1 hypothetical protein AX769_19845 [Frondihabitans sp. PAMC 28766]